MTKIIYRRLQILLCFLSLIVLSSSFYFQYIKELEPCPLCLMQRLAVFFLFTLCFVGIGINSQRRGKSLAVLQFIFAAAGLFFASRQLWLQSLPLGQVPACMPGLDILIHYFPWKDVLKTLLWGDGDCAKVTWEWLGLSMPAWSALYFLVMLIVAIVLHWSLTRWPKD